MGMECIALKLLDVSTELMVCLRQGLERMEDDGQRVDLSDFGNECLWVKKSQGMRTHGL